MTNICYTKKEINEILALKGWLNQEVDVFNLYDVLTIGISSNPDEWEIKQTTYSESKLPITLEDFKDCQTQEDIRKTFSNVLRKAVSQQLFRGAV